MQKFLLCCVSFMTLPALAHPITSPFYLPDSGHVLTQTSAVFNKNKIKTNTSTRTYHQGLAQQMVLGLGGGLAAQLQGDLNWLRQKQAPSVPHAKAYNAGLNGVWDINGVLTRLNVFYRQSSNVQTEPRRAIHSHFYVGKSLKNMTPYLHVSTRIPLNARPVFNDPVYRAETGVFQPIKTSMTLDTALYLQYDKNIKERSYGIRAQWSYLISSWMSFGLNGEWQARGHARNNAHTYHQSVGATITLAF